MSSLKEILAHRGRIIVFTQTASVGLKIEQIADRNHAKVVCTRGWVDIYGPLLEWNRIYHSREYGLLSCDQRTYFNGIQLVGTDFVWVGNCFDTPEILMRYRKAGDMAMDNHARLWTIAEDTL